MTKTVPPIVVALGGNAISPIGVHDSIPRQFKQTRETSVALVDIIVGAAPVVITHGNGPQIGSAIRRTELAAHEVYEIPLGISVADVQGGMGYMISQCLVNETIKRGAADDVSTIITSVEVAADDPAFSNPTKPIGPLYPAERAGELRRRGWDIVDVRGTGVRRVVPSPVPTAIVEIDLIRALVRQGRTIIVAGGGGIPVVRHDDGTLHGREAVIDKDLVSALLAREIEADRLLIVTGVERVAVAFGTPRQRDLERLTVAEARRHLESGEFPPGSMGPKIAAAVNFLEGSTRDDARVIISDIPHMADALEGRAGTTITRD